MGFYASLCRSSGYLVVRGHKVSWESADSSRLWGVRFCTCGCVALENLITAFSYNALYTML